MAVLKDHMLVEIAVDLCARAHPDVPMLVIETLPGVENFMLSGKGPFRTFLRLVIDDVNITSVSSDSIRMECIDSPWTTTLQLPASYQWQLKSVFLNTLFMKLVQKLKMGAFEWLYAYPRIGYCEMLAQKSDLKYLYVDNDRFHDWDTIFKAFPRLLYLTVSGNNFASVLFAASMELGLLRQVVLIIKDDESALQAHQALSNHRNKCPKLKAIAYVTESLTQIKFPNIGAPVSSIHHLQIITKIKCCTPFDFSLVTAAQKMFPSLNFVHFNARAKCQCNSSRPVDNDQRLKAVDALYQSFDSLNFGFPVKVIYAIRFKCYEKDVNELRQFFGTKGKVFGRRDRFAVKVSASEKSLTFRVHIKIMKNPKL
uniref:FBD domain-containing protein n=1 Tax=Panagrellus redivivus TaxID=6233 RepID=A0A7E4ZWM8_PANRE